MDNYLCRDSIFKTDTTGNPSYFSIIEAEKKLRALTGLCSALIQKHLTTADPIKLNSDFKLACVYFACEQAVNHEEVNKPRPTYLDLLLRSA